MQHAGEGDSFIRKRTRPEYNGPPSHLKVTFGKRNASFPASESHFILLNSQNIGTSHIFFRRLVTASMTRCHDDLDATIAQLRVVVEDRLDKHLASSAIFFADKLVTMSGGALGDVFLHAKALYLGTHYRRAFATLHRGGLIPRKLNPGVENGSLRSRTVDPRAPTDNSCRLLAAQCLAAVKDWDGCLAVLGERDDGDSKPLIEETVTRGEQNPSLQGCLTSARSGVVRQRTKASRVEQLDRTQGHGTRKREYELRDGSVSLRASLCFMRGKAHCALENWKSAELWCKEALTLDPYCFEAFDLLISSHLLSVGEEDRFLSSLQIRPEDKWVPSLYGTICHSGFFSSAEGSLCVASSHGHMNQATDVRCNLPPESDRDVCNACDVSNIPDALHSQTSGTQPELFALKCNSEVILARSERYFNRGDYQRCYDAIQELVANEPTKLAAIPCYLAVTVELRMKTKLYLCAHKLVEEYPAKAISWFAVACYYYCTRQFDSARRYFGKATTLEASFVPAWLGFGHAFAAQDESDQAMAAYRTATRLYPGCHLSLLCIGMEYHRTNNFNLAGQFLSRARHLRPADPLVYNELGALAFHNGDHVSAISHLEKAIALIPQPVTATWEAILVNLAHSNRKLNNFDEAIFWYEQALSLAPRDASTYTALGFTHQLKGNFQSRMEKAIECYHRALSLKPNDDFAQEMLTLALIDQCAVTMPPYNFVAYDAHQPLPVKSERRS